MYILTLDVTYLTTAVLTPCF